MNSKTIKTLVLGAMAAYIFGALALVSFAELGILPVQADVVPSPLETTVLILDHKTRNPEHGHAGLGQSPVG